MTWHIDRSRVVARELCPEKRRLQYHYGGLGITPEAASSPHLEIGLGLHAGWKLLLEGDSLGAACEAACADLDVPEWRWLTCSLLHVWAAERLPSFAATYELVESEVEHDWTPAPGVSWPVRYDAVVARRSDKQLVIADMKTASSLRSFAAKWQVDPQTFAYLAAAPGALGEPVAGLTYEGVEKGSWKIDTAKSSRVSGQRVFATPLCYAWGVTAGDLSPDYRKGWQKWPTWERYAEPALWLDVLQRTRSLGALCATVPELSLPPHVLEQWLEQVLAEEAAYAAQDLSRPQPRHRSSCFKFGSDYPCEFSCFCNEGVLLTGAVPEGFTARTPHHAGEEEAAA